MNPLMKIEINKYILINNLLSKIKDVYPSIASHFFCLQYIYGTAKNDFPYLEVEKEINQSEYGKIFSYEEALLFFDKMTDIYELLILVSPTKEKFRRYKKEDERYENNLIVIEYFDSGHIEINTVISCG